MNRELGLQLLTAFNRDSGLHEHSESVSMSITAMKKCIVLTEVVGSRKDLLGETCPCPWLELSVRHCP